jgi:hypothetical protein
MEALAFIAIVAIGIYVKVKALDNLVGGKEDDTEEND